MRRLRFALVAALGTVVGCGTSDSHAPDTVHPSTTSVPSVAPRVAPTPVVAMLPCLRADSLRSPNDTLHFSSLRIHEETGDQLGTDLQLVRVGATWGGRVALAEGVLGQYDPIRVVRLDTATGELAMNFDHDDRPAEFHGALACATVIGEFRWGPGAEPHPDTLPRQQPDSASAR